MTGLIRDLVSLTLLLIAIACAAGAVALWVSPAAGLAAAGVVVAALGVYVGMDGSVDEPADAPGSPEVE